MIYDVKKQGAAGDGKTDDTAVIQKGIDTCFQNGGGSVILSDGIYVSGTLYLKSNVRLHITESAVLLASGEIEKYGTDTHYNRYRNEPDMDRCFLYAQDQENITITGGGMILGNAEAFPNEGSIYRPMMMRFLRCRNIRLSHLRLYDAAAWTTAFLDSSWIWVDGVDIRNEKRYNGDGLDFDGCSHVFVSNCSIRGTDDNLCLQAGSREYPVEDVHITGCSFSSLCAAIRIGLKSIGDISDVAISSCTMKNVWREGIKVECSEGGSITDITVNNLTMKNVSRPIFLLLNNRFLPDGLGSSLELTEMPEIGRMERLIFSNIIATDTEEMGKVHRRFENDIMGAPWFSGIRVDAEREHKIKDLTFTNIRYTAYGGVKSAQIPQEYPQVTDQKKFPGSETSENYYPDWSRTVHMDIRNVEGLVLENVRFAALHEDERPGCLVEGCDD